MVVKIQPARILAGSEIPTGDYNGGAIQGRQGRFTAGDFEEEE